MENAHFHHVHLNVLDKAATIAFYQKFFGAKYVKYRNRADALLTEKSFLLMDVVNETPPTNIGTSLWHIGWSGVDGQSEFDWRVKEGIEVHTPVTPLREDHWMYFHGPNKELLEVFTGNKNHTFEHIHLFATNVDETMAWFKENLGLSPVFQKAEPWANGLFKWNYMLVDNINIYVYGKPNSDRPWWPQEFKKTEGTALDHIAFSFREIESVYDTMKSDGVEIIAHIKTDETHGIKSFFIRGPNRLLIEIVEEKPIPDGIWD